MTDRPRHVAPAQGVPACDPLEKRLDAIDRALVHLGGKDGDNGKVGAIKDRVDKLEDGRSKALKFAAGLVIALVTAGIAFGGWMSSTRTDLAWLKQRTFHPADAPGKDSK